MKRKVKRFNEGGDYESSDDYKNLEAAATREKNEYMAGETAKTEPLKMASFSILVRVESSAILSPFAL